MGISGRDYMRDRSVLDGSSVDPLADTSRPWLTWVFGGVFLVLWLVFAASWGPGYAPEGSAARDVWANLVLSPGSEPVSSSWWRPFTAMWFHDPVGVQHLLISFALLLLFCPQAERTWGAGRLALVLVGGGLVSMLAAWASSSLVATKGWTVLGPTGGLFAVATGLAWRGRGTYVSYFGRGPWPLARVAVIAMVVAAVFLSAVFEGRGVWPVLPLGVGHLVAMAAGVALLRVPNRAHKREAGRLTQTPARHPEPQPPPESEPQDDPTRDRVDALLAKISSEGMAALSDEERAFLADASKGYR